MNDLKSLLLMLMGIVGICFSLGVQASSDLTGKIIICEHQNRSNISTSNMFGFEFTSEKEATRWIYISHRDEVIPQPIYDVDSEARVYHYYVYGAKIDIEENLSQGSVWETAWSKVGTIHRKTLLFTGESYKANCELVSKGEMIERLRLDGIRAKKERERIESEYKL